MVALKRVVDRLEWLVLVGPALLLGPGLLQGNVLFWGTPLLQFIPWRTFALESLRGGHLPLWNPLVGMGAPLLANYQSAVFYPPSALLWILEPAAASTLLVALHLAWAGFGMARLARRLEMNALGQVVAGTAFSLSGYLVARAGFFSINAAAAWLPWIILAGDRLAADHTAAGGARPRWAAVLMLALALALQWTAGHAQTAWYTLVLLAVWMAWRILRLRSWRRAVVVVIGTAAAGLLAFAFAAPQLLPTLEYLRESQRAQSLDPAFAMTYSFWPWRFLGLLAPGSFGSPVSGDYWGYGNFWEDATYVGVLPLLLAVVGALRGLSGRAPHSGLARLLVGLMAITTILALGSHTPVFPWLFGNVATFDLFQAPTRWMLLFVFALALLAGAGASAWKRAEGRALYWSRLGTAGACAVLALGWLAPTLVPIVPEPAGLRALTISRGLSLAGLWLALSGVLVLLRRDEPHPAWTWAASLLVVADLVVAGGGINPMTGADLYRGRSALADQLGASHRSYMPADLEAQAKFDWAFRFDTFAALDDWRRVREVGLPNALLLDAAPSANNFDPLAPGRTTVWMEMLDAHPAPEALLALMDVAWVAAPAPSGVLPMEYLPVGGAQRVRVVPEAVLAPTADEALALVRAPGFDPETLLVLEPLEGERVPDDGGTGTAVLLPTIDANRVEVRVEAAAPAWLVVSDTWYPGWQAEIDGERVALWRADYIFRAVRVPAGEHTVHFVYRPASLRIGLWLATLAVLAAGFSGWLARRRSTPQPGATPS